MIGKSVCDKKLCNLQSARKLVRFLLWFRVFSHSISCQPLLWNEAKWNQIQIYIFQSPFLYQQKKTNFFPDAIKTFIFSHQQKRGLIVLKTEWKTNESNRSRQRVEKRITVRVLVLRAGGKSISHIGFRIVRSPYFSYFILYLFLSEWFFLLLWISTKKFILLLVFFESCWVCLVLLLLDLV